jgi:hypothetical protein
MTLSEAMVPDKLEWLGRALPDEQAKVVHDYVGSLSASNAAGWPAHATGSRSSPSQTSPTTSTARSPRAIASICSPPSNAATSSCSGLDSDRRPLLAGMLAAAIVQDLLTIAAELQHQPVPTLVLVDEFSAIAPGGIKRLPTGLGVGGGSWCAEHDLVVRLAVPAW